jgi:hypothetical protein
LSYAEWNEAPADVRIAFIFVIVLAVPDQVDRANSGILTGAIIAEGTEGEDKAGHHRKEER